MDHDWKIDSIVHLNNETIKKSQDIFQKENEGGIKLPGGYHSRQNNHMNKIRIHKSILMYGEIY